MSDSIVAVYNQGDIYLEIRMVQLEDLSWERNLSACSTWELFIRAARFEKIVSYYFT